MFTKSKSQRQTRGYTKNFGSTSMAGLRIRDFKSKVSQIATRAIRRSTEKKYLDTTSSATLTVAISQVATSSGTNTGTALTTINQGNTENTRVGNRVKPLSLTLNGIITRSPASLSSIVTGITSATYVRLIVYQLRTNDSAATQTYTSQLLESSAITPGLPSPHNYRYAHLYNYLYDKTFKMPLVNPGLITTAAWTAAPGAIWATNQNNFDFRFSKKINLVKKRCKHLTWDANTPIEGQIFYNIFFDQSADQGTNIQPPTYQLYTRFIYEDI